MFTAETLHRALHGLGVMDPGDIFEQLAIAYAQPWRHYHTQAHISACLQEFVPIRSMVSHADEIEVALWFHDAIYEPQRQDNEERSAQWAQDYLTSAGASQGSIQLIVTWIRMTKSHQSTDAASAMLMDIDLSILGAPAETFEIYDAAIRREYHWISDQQYRTGRYRVLASFLERPAIYQTSHFQSQYEAQAQTNLIAKLRDLNPEP